MNICTRQSAFIGPDNQEKLKNVSVAIIGLGALGSASAHLLVRMGVGTLILCDDDVVEDNNLGRQHLYTLNDIGRKKSDALAMRLLEIRSDLIIRKHSLRITKNNISCCDSADIIVDGTDNHATRRVIDIYAKQKNISWVHGAAIEDKGTVVFFSPTRFYDSIYLGKIKDAHCSVSGVLVTTTTMVATLQTHLVLLSVIGKQIPAKMYRLEGLNWSEIDL